MRELRLYSRAFNRDEKIHYIFDTHARYLDEINSYLLFTIPFNSYQINNGRIFVSPKYVNVAGVETETTLDDLSRVCYVADVEYDDESNITRAVYYFVRRCFDQSGNMFLDVERDLWASSLLKGVFGNCHLVKCDRILNVDMFMIPNVDNTTYKPTIIEMGSKISYSDASVVFVLETALPSVLQGSVSKTFVMAISLKAIYDYVHATYPDYDNVNLVDKACDIVGGIHAVFAGGIDTDAYVSKAWIVPNESLPTSSISINGIKTRGIYTHNNEMVLTADVIPAGRFIKEIEPLAEYETKTGNKMYIAAYAEVGTKYSSMPFQKGYASTSPDKYVFYEYIFDGTGVNVIVEQGTKHKDITTSFELSLNTNGASANSLMAQSKFIGKISNSMLSLVGNIAMGNVLGAVGSVVTSGTSILQDTANNSVNKAPANGDGALTFRYNATEINSPYALRVYGNKGSQYDEITYKGVPYDFYSSFAFFMTAEEDNFVNDEPLSKGFAAIMFDYMEIDGLNMEEEKFFKDEFARGIRIHNITP